MEKKFVFTVTENGFTVDGTNRVCVPHCKIIADSYGNAVKKLDLFLSTKELSPDIELITPIERIKFE